MKKVIKSLLITLLALIAACAVALAVLWQSYTPPDPSETTAAESDDLDVATRTWLQAYVNRLQGWRVPPSYQVRSVTIESTEKLNDTSVQINYQLKTMLKHGRFAEAFDASYVSDHVYAGQLAVVWTQGEGGAWSISDIMRPAAWQIAFDPEIQAERQQAPTVHYDPTTYDGLAYLVQNDTLFVTYDEGETYLEVPDGYDKVCLQSNGTHLERLRTNGYIVTPELTAFLTYSDEVRPNVTYGSSEDYDYGSYSGMETACLYYSLDEGQSWQTSPIAYGYRANDFLSLTAEGIYASFAVDRALGSDYYTCYFSSDLTNWTAVDLPEHQSNLTCVYWAPDGTGYFSGPFNADSTQQCIYYATTDGGESYQRLLFPLEDEYVEYGEFPYRSLDGMYDEDGVRYAILGPGQDTDYAEAGASQLKLLYRSEDGLNFTFVKAQYDNTIYAG